MVRRLGALGLLMVAASCTSAMPASTPSVTPKAADAPRQTATDVMRRVVETYEALTSYQDEGVVLSYGGRTPLPNEMHFKTYFRAPEHFRFEWIKHSPYPRPRGFTKHFVLWSNDQGTFTRYWARSRNEEGLGMALAGATGISNGAITTIPGLIFGPDKVLWSVADVRGLSLLEPEDFEGTPCIRVRGTLRRGTVEVSIWIGRDDLMIRRIVFGNPPGAAGVQRTRSEEIRRNVMINERIADETFELTPP